MAGTSPLRARQTRGGFAAASAGAIVALVVVTVVIGSRPAVGAGIFSAKESESDVWRTETSRLSLLAAEQRSAESESGRRRLRQVEVVGDITDIAARKKDSSSSEAKSPRGKTPRTPKSPNSFGSSEEDCIPQPMPPCPSPPPPHWSGSSPPPPPHSVSSSDATAGSGAAESDDKQYELIFFDGVICYNDFLPAGAGFTKVAAGQQVSRVESSSADGGDSDDSYPLCSEVALGTAPSPSSDNPHGLPLCPPPINPACPPDHDSSSDSETSEHSGDTDDSDGSSQIGSDGSSDEDVSSGDSSESPATTPPSPTVRPPNNTYGTNVCLDGKALNRGQTYTLALLEEDFPGINNCLLMPRYPVTITLTSQQSGSVETTTVPSTQECDELGRYIIFRPQRAGILNINVDGWTDDISGTCPVNGARITTETITASGPGLEVAFLNEQNVVIICAEDEEGTPVYDNSLLVSPTMNLTVFLQPVQTVVNVTRTVAIPNQPGCVDFNFTPTALQPVTIGIFWNLDAIQDSPFVVPVLDNSSRPDFDRYTVTGPGTNGRPVESNTNYQILITPRDPNGNAIDDNGVFLPVLSDGGVDINVNYGVDQEQSIPATVSYNSNTRRYEVNYRTPRPGYLSIAVSARESQAQGSPFVTVINGAAVTSETVCGSGIGTTTAVAGIDSFIEIRARDSDGFEVYNDAIVFGNLSVTATNSTGVTANSIFLESLNGQPGRYRLHYFATRAGQFIMQVLFAGGNIAGCPGFQPSPFVIAVVESQASARRTLIEGGNYYGSAIDQPVAARVRGHELVRDQLNVGLNYQPADGYANGHTPLPVEIQFERVEEDLMVVYTVRYVPNLPGTYSIDIKVNDESASTLMAQVMPANPPQPLSAAFEDSLVAVRMTFDRDTNMAGMIGRGDCSQILDDTTVRSLGVGAQCVWRDARTLLMYLSPDASLRPGSSVTLRPFTLRSSIENGDFSVGNARVAGPNRPEPITAVLTGPNVLGPCDTLSLSALDTRGGVFGGVRYSWLVTAPDSAGQGISEVKAKLATHDGPTLDLPAGALPSGHTYVFSVRVASIWGSRDTATLTVTADSAPTRPAVTMFGPPAEYIDAANSLLLEGSASNPAVNCAQGSSSAGDISYSWSVVPTIYFHSSMQQMLENPKLIVPTGLMEPGRSYTWTLMASSSDGGSSSASKVVNVALPPISVEGALGPDRAVSTRSNVYLTAVAEDPLEELLSGVESEEWTHKWSCLRRCWAGGREHGCDPSAEGEECDASLRYGLAAQRGAAATILAGGLDAGYRYMFQCLISRGPLFNGNGELQHGRVRLASVVVEAVDERALSVDIFGAPAGGSVNAHESLVLDCEVDEATTPTSPASTHSYSWSLTAGNFPLGHHTLAEAALSIAGMSSAGQRRLVLPPNVLTPGQEVALTCLARSPDGASSGIARLPLFVRPLPSGGTLALAVTRSDAWALLDPSKPLEMAEAGISLVDASGDSAGDIVVGGFEELATVFRFSAVGWSYPGQEALGNHVEPQLRYQFFYVVGAARRVPLTNLQSSSTTKAILPAGVVKIEVDVIGPGGVTTTYEHPVSVLVNEETQGGDVAAQAGDGRSAELPALTSRQRQLYSRVASEQNLEMVSQFVRTWASRRCSKARSVPDTATCGTAPDEEAVTKASMVEDMVRLDGGRALSGGYVELLSCSMAPVTCNPTRLTAAGQDGLLQVLNNVLLQGVLTQPTVALSDSSACYQVALDNLWRAAEESCSVTSTRLKSRMVDMTSRFAVALSQDNVPGALQLQSVGDVVEVVTSRALGGVAQVLASEDGLEYRARVSGLQAQDEVCMAAWVYKTSDPSSTNAGEDAVHPAPHAAAAPHHSGPAFGFTAAVNCTAPLRTVAANVTLSMRLTGSATGLACWRESTQQWDTIKLDQTLAATSRQVTAATTHSGQPTELCIWVTDGTQEASLAGGDAADGAGRDTPAKPSSDVVPWYSSNLFIGLLCTVLVLMVGALLGVAIRRRHAQLQAEALRKSIQQRQQQQPQSGFHTNPLMSSVSPARPAPDERREPVESEASSPDVPRAPLGVRSTRSQSRSGGL